MQTGVYSAKKKDGTVYYRANITYQTKHANWHISQLTDAPIIQTYKPYDYERPLPDGVQY